MVFGVVVPDPVFAGTAALALAVFIGLASWALYQLVQNGQLLAALSAEYKERSEDHERRLTALEAKRFVSSNRR